MSGPVTFRRDMIVITVTWMDGEVRVYRGVSGDVNHRLENGVLSIDGFMGIAGTRHLPLANIREITVEVEPGGRVSP